MDYEKAYKEALERARKCLDEKRDSCFVRPDVIFPELKENEDEKIRKALIGIISNYVDDSNTFKPKMIAWLEKQGEKKSAWSEEDEVKVNRIVSYLENFNVSDNDILLKDVDWLKSLKQRMEQ